MNRRVVLKQIGLSTAAFCIPIINFQPEHLVSEQVEGKVLRQIEKLHREPPLKSEIRMENGGPRLYVNNHEIYPMWGMSASLLDTTPAYRKSGINYLSVILGLNSAWIGPQKYDWSKLDYYHAKLLEMNPNAYFLPRLQLNAPRWWEDAHPEELVKYGLPYDEKEHRMEERLGEAGLNWYAGRDTYDPSLASKIWIEDLSDLLRAYLQHIENSPLRSRMMGYQVTSAMTAEWHYIGSRYLPDYSKPMQEKVGKIPSAEERMNTAFGLLRDPAKEKDVIEFYQKFHENTANTILHFARIVKEETNRRVICGTFYAYIMENVMIQEAGHLAPQIVLNSQDIDFIASPYTYQHTNIPGKGRWESDMVDDAGNWLGRARGEAGDGGYRVPVESVKRYKKLFIVEWDPSTYLEPVKRTEGGSGSQTLEGTLHILQRDMGRMFAGGIGGWFLDFGHFTPPFRANRGWYDDEPMINEISKFAKLGNKRQKQNIKSVSEILAVFDAKSFFISQHWKAEKPWKGFGISVSDFFNHWFVNSQARTFHRIGSPMDFLFRFDLTQEDTKIYRLFFMVNQFFLTDEEVDFLSNLFRDSGATVVWYYAPGLVTPDKLDLNRMQQLTGFRFRIINEKGPMMIRTAINDTEMDIEGKFGVKKEHFPRFAVTDTEAQILGYWVDRKAVAFASKEYTGYRSVYLGAAPLPVNILRWLAKAAGVSLWSNQPDIITATEDATCLVATKTGERILRLPKPQRLTFNGKVQIEHRLRLEFGDVRVFISD